jgi:hypothetical protein
MENFQKKQEIRIQTRLCHSYKQYQISGIMVVAYSCSVTMIRLTSKQTTFLQTTSTLCMKVTNAILMYVLEEIISVKNKLL